MEALQLDSGSSLRLSLSDVALLAKVQRPVVSAWRTRGARSGMAFPAPAATTRGQDFFDAEQVVDWLELSGRGNNPDARADLAAHAALTEAPLHDAAAFAGLTALLCLHVTSGALPLTAEELLDLADEVDPDDEHLFSEVESLGDRLPALARHTERLVDAAYHPAAAFEVLTASWARAQVATPSTSSLAAPARAVVVDVALALAAHAGTTDPVFVDPTGGSDLLVDIARRAGEAGGCSVAVPRAMSPARRLALRRLHVHRINRTPLSDDAPRVPGGSVVVLQVPAAGEPAMTELEVLQAVDDVVLGTPEHQQVVVVAAAGALTDRLPVPRAGPGRPPRDAEQRSEASRTRDAVLRTGRVRAVVRLPAGLLPGRSRQRLALWCLGPDPRPRPAAGAAPAEARVLVGDLTNTPLDPVTGAGLVADLVAGMTGPRAWEAHAPRHLRPVFTRTLLAHHGDLVAPVPAAGPPVPVVAVLDELRALRESLDAGVPLLARRPVRARQTPATVVPGTVAAALRRGELAAGQGTRLRPELLGTAGGARVIGVLQVADPAAPRPAVDRLALAAHHPDAQYTEPGDVVFTTSPRPRAVVDVDGGSVVAFPAQVLRCRADCFVPAVLAADVDAQAPSARTWRAWVVRRVPPDQGAALTAALDDVARHRAALHERLAAVDRFAAALTTGAATGSLDLTPHD